jgi:two-component system, chemotaxis family, sensor kinase Cph1
MGAFFRTGLAAGERCMIAVDTADPDDLLAAIGSPAELAGWEKAGRLTIRTAPDPGQPRRPLTFDQMMDVWGELIDRARFARMRLGGEASWWLHQTSQERLLRYDSEMNRTIPAELAVLCLYDLNRFSAGVLVDVVQTHPRALINEMIIENPYYTEPCAYLARRKPTSVRSSGSPRACPKVPTADATARPSPPARRGLPPGRAPFVRQ